MIGPENSKFCLLSISRTSRSLEVFQWSLNFKRSRVTCISLIKYYVYLRPNKITVSCRKHLGFIDWSHLPEAEVGVVAGLGVEDEALKIEITITINHEAAIVSQTQQRNSLTLQCHARIQ